MSTKNLLDISRELADAVDTISFNAPITHVYNSVMYTWEAHANYLDMYGTQTPREALLIGMNPGPWGMAQTGVPFGHVPLIRDWLGVSGTIEKPPIEHPKRPIEGFNCKRKEVSGARLWGWAKERFETPTQFFSRFFVTCYCPLSFMEESGRNRTPDKLPKAKKQELFPHCDKALRDTVLYLKPTYVFPVGAFVESRARHALKGLDVTIQRVLHPSPASPQAQHNWSGKAEDAMEQAGFSI